MCIKEIINELNGIKGVSSAFIETWSSLTFKGCYNGTYSKSYFSDLYSIFKENKIEKALSIFLDNEKLQIQAFINELNDGDSWKIHINKNIWNVKPDGRNICHTFFYDLNKFISWIKDSDPFDADYPLNKHPYHIYVNGLTNPFSGNNFIVNSSDDTEGFVIETYSFYQRIEDTIRLACDSDFKINPEKHIVIKGKVDDVSKPFYENAIKVLLCSLCDEITKDKQVVIRGYRRNVLEIGYEDLDNQTLFEYHKVLVSVVNWVYESENTYLLKKKLFAERVSLDFDNRTSLFCALCPILSDVYIQLKEQYAYMLYERKDEYQKELKDLLKDLKSISDLCSVKIRIILKNLLRDVLAALVLIGITLFSRIQELDSLLNNHLFDYVFNAFGLYFCCSVILQLFFDGFDVYRTFKELEYWKTITHLYISDSQFKQYKKQMFFKRFWGSCLCYGIVVLLYV